MSYFINATNHPSTKWSAEQLKAAQGYGEVYDLPFPNVDPTASSEDVKRIAHGYAADIAGMAGKGGTALVQGEGSLMYHTIKFLTEQYGVNCVVACSDRKTVERVNEQGETVKTAVFSFVQFRAI